MELRKPPKRRKIPHRGDTAIFRSFAVAAILLTTMPALANDLRDLCADRPGLGTPACTLDKGHFMVELGIADWARDRDDSVRTDAVTVGDALLRIGLTDSLEAQVGWTAFGHVREKDRISGLAKGVSEVGDVTLALRQNLRNLDGSGFSVALMPYAALPAGGEPVAAGDWGRG
jgi:hypothetical protein